MNKRKKILLLTVCIVIFALLDRISKEWAKGNLKDQDPIIYFHNTFRFEYVENTGAWLSMGDKIPQPYNLIIFSIIPVICIILILYWVIKKLNEIRIGNVILLAMIFAGGIGNITDRIFYDRHVTDFMNMGIGNLRTGIFNVADLFVTTGVIGLFIFARNGEIFGKKREML